MIPAAVPVGAILPFAGPVSTYDTDDKRRQHLLYRLSQAGWLLCDGRLMPQGDYPELFGLIGKSFGGNDTCFNLPDMQGCFMRGVIGNQKKCNPERTSAAEGGNVGNRVGSYQTDAFQTHQHDYTEPDDSNKTNQAEKGGGVIVSQAKSDTSTTRILPDSGKAIARAASETRPVNLNMNFIIRYR